MQRQVTVVAWLSMIAAAGCRESAWTPMGSAELVLSEIKLGGVPAVSKRIDSDENFGRSVMSGISTGDSLWLEVADKITPASAAAQATVSIALASALTRSPDRVLALTGDKYPVEEVCGIPFLKGDSAFVSTYHDEAFAALGRVRSVSQVSARDACRTALDDARDRRLERINPSYIVKNKPVVPAPRPRKKVVKPPVPDAAPRPVPAPQPVTPQDTSSSR